jgi:hypothetical protein
VVQLVEHLLCKHKTFLSNPNLTRDRDRERERERERDRDRERERGRQTDQPAYRQTETRPVDKTGLKLLGSSESPASAS